MIRRPHRVVESVGDTTENKKWQNQKSLLEGEKRVLTLQSEMYAQSNNIIVNILATIIGFIATILGCAEVGTLTVTRRQFFSLGEFACDCGGFLI